MTSKEVEAKTGLAGSTVRLYAKRLGVDYLQVGSVKEYRWTEEQVEKLATSRRPGGRPRLTEKIPLKLKVMRDGKPRTLHLLNDGKPQYGLYIEYPDGQMIGARYQPDEKNGIPDIRYWAGKNGFEPVAENAEKKSIICRL